MKKLKIKQKKIIKIEKILKREDLVCSKYFCGKISLDDADKDESDLSKTNPSKNTYSSCTTKTR